MLPQPLLPVLLFLAPFVVPAAPPTPVSSPVLSPVPSPVPSPLPSPMLSQAPTRSVPVANAVPSFSDSRGLVGSSEILYSLTLEADSITTLLVVGNGASDLDAYLYDPAGGLVEVDDGPSDVCFLQARPEATGAYALRIVNRGTGTNRYALFVR